MQKSETLNVRLPKEVIKQIDSLIEEKLYNSRSEVIREFLREYVLEQSEKEDANGGNQK